MSVLDHSDQTRHTIPSQIPSEMGVNLRKISPLKTSGDCVPPALTIGNAALCTYGFHMILKTETFSLNSINKLIY